MAKIPTITLSHSNFRGEESYRVAKVTDSIEYSPGAYLPKDKVRELCESPSWKVTIFADNPR